jgi:hypothetical protein
MGTHTIFRGKLKTLKSFMRNGLPKEKGLYGHLMLEKRERLLFD